jgi:hypothetical protein
MITIIAEITCEFCDLTSSYVMEDLEELLDVVAEDNWIVEFDDEGNIAHTYCCPECKEEDSEKDEDFISIEEDGLKDELSNNGMHIEIF